MVTSVTNITMSKNGHDFNYCDYEGLSTDTKPTTGVANMSSFLEAVVDPQTGEFQNKWRIYKFNAANLTWLKFVEWTV